MIEIDRQSSPWRPMAEAPRDGTFIIALWSDFSGAEVLFWDNDKEGWCDLDYEPWSEEWISDNYYGWVPAPPEASPKLLKYIRDDRTLEDMTREGRDDD